MAMETDERPPTREQSEKLKQILGPKHKMVLEYQENLLQFEKKQA